MLLFFLIGIVIFLVGGLLILRNSANIPKIPKDFETRSYDEDEDEDGW